MLVCKKCGNKVSEGEKFCMFCGTKIEAVVAQPAQVEVKAEPIVAPVKEEKVAPVKAEPIVAPVKTEVEKATPIVQPIKAQAKAQSAPKTSEQGMNFDFSTNTATSIDAPELYEYKVLTQKDKWFSGKFDPEKLETALNAYAQQGWRVIGCATADVPGFGTARQEFITVLERKK